MKHHHHHHHRLSISLTAYDVTIRHGLKPLKETNRRLERVRERVCVQWVTGFWGFRIVVPWALATLGKACVRFSVRRIDTPERVFGQSV
ncbi:hypothetical protein P167DRAFT_165779 [Morchella conica CCBAS932]|uniref:Uncharacterized protein n=1 Tax=Morchella conica CCBAS932 TaxID=1392247 RepID=A0A3N4KUW2_9PEZI|nr:hypothetical protein P167DRAFT_165779 [Morchella conica CCBAS932]